MDGRLKIPRLQTRISLRTRAIALLLLLLIGLLALMYLLSEEILLQSFKDLEQTQAHDDTQRVLNILDNEMTALGMIAEDWGAWDDTYQFVQDGNTTYIDSNLVDETFVTLDLDVMVFLDESNTLVYGKAYFWEQESSLILTQEMMEIYLLDGPLSQNFDAVMETQGLITGMITTPLGPMLTGIHPILTSHKEGPAQGIIMVGRYINEPRVAALAETTNQVIGIYRAEDPDLPDDFVTMREILTPEEPIRIHVIDDNTLGGYALLYDISSTPAFMLRTTLPRDTFLEGRGTVQFFLLSLVAGGLFMVLGLMLLLERQVLVRVLRLNSAVRAIGAGDHLRLEQRVPSTGNDELTALARSINQLLETAQRAQQSLTESQLRTQQIVSSISDVLYVAHMNEAREIIDNQLPSPQIADLTGYPRSRFDKDWTFWQSLILPEDYAHAMLTDEQVARGGSREIEYRIQDAKGDIHWIRDSIYIDVQQDNTVALYGVLSDITARKQIEADLAAREQTAREFQDRLKALLHVSTELAQAPDMDTLLRRTIELGRSELGFDRLGLWRLSDDHTTMIGTYGTDAEGNLSNEQHLRRRVADDPSAEEMLRDHKWTHMEDNVPLHHEWEVVGQGWHLMSSLWEGDHMLGWFVADNLMTGAPLASYQAELLSLYSATVAQLITRQRAEQALRESEERYVTLFQRMPVELYRTTPDGTLLDANSAMVQLMGYPDLDTMRQVSVNDMYADPADRERWREAIDRAGELYDYEIQFKRRDGSIFWGRNTTRTVYDEDGNILYYEGHNRDVTAEKAAEEALATERNLLRTLIDALPDHIYAKDAKARVLLSNEGNARVMGAAGAADVIGKTDADFYPPELAARYLADDMAVIHTGEPVLNRVEPIYQDPADLRWIRTTKVPLRDAEGNVIGLVGVGHDVTVERQIAEALHNSQERLDLALQAAGLGLWDWYVQTGQVVFNDRWADIAGYSLNELGAQAGMWAKMVHPDDWPEVDRRLQAHLEGHTAYFEAEYRLRTKAGTVKWVYDRGRVVQRDDDHAALRMIGTLQDISERRQTEHALRESQERLDFVLRGANLGTWDWAIQTDEQVVNEQWAEMLGYTLDEVSAFSKNWRTLLHPDDKEKVLRAQAAHFAGDTPYYESEFRMRTKDGGWCWVQSRGQVMRRGPDNTPLRMSGTHLDITARKQADAEREDLLQQTRTRAAELATVAEVSRQASQILNVDELLWAVCELMQDNFDLYHVQVYLQEGDWLRLVAGTGDAGRQMVALNHAIALTYANSVVAEAARTRQVVVANDVTQADAFLPNALLPETRSEIALPMIVGDQIIGVLDVQDRITDRFRPQDIQIQKTLAAQVGIAIYNARLFTDNARRLAIIEHSQDSIALTSLDAPNYFPVYLNPTGLRTLGYEGLDDFDEQTTLAAFYPPEDFARLKSEILPEVLAQGSWRGELTVRHRDGTLTPVEQTFFLIHDEQGRPQDLATIMIDITPRKQAEAALHRANRAYRALSECDQASIRATDEKNLLREVCDIVVRVSGYRMAWVGLTSVDNPTQVHPVAHAGHENGYLDHVMALRHQRPDISGASARAIQASQPFVVNDVATAPEFVHWRAEALARGYRSTVALPLISEGDVLGVLNVYAAEPHAFDAPELALLVELADDLAFGIATLRTRLERQRVVNELEQRNRELLALHDVTHTLTATLDEQAIYRLLYTQVVQPLFGAETMIVAVYDEDEELLGCEFAITDGVEQDPGTLPPLPLGDGPNSVTIRTGKARIVALSADDSPADPPGTYIVLDNDRVSRLPRTALYVPLISGGKVIGALNIQHYEPNAFSENDIPLLSAAANQAVVAIQNARLFAAEREQRALSEALGDVAAAVNSTLDPDTVLDRILENLKRVVPHDAASIMIIEHDDGRIVRHMGFDERGLTEAVENLRLDVSEKSRLLSDFRDARAVLIHDTREDKTWQHEPGLEWIRAYIGVPIKVGEQIVGILNLDSATPGFFTMAHVKQVQAFAEQVAIAIQNARLFAAEREQRTLAEALADTAAAVNSTLDPDVVMDRILDNLRRIVSLDSASVMLIQGDEARIVRHTGFEERGLSDYVEGLRFPVAQMTKFKGMENSGKPVHLTDTREAEDWVSSPELDWIRSYVGAPIMVGERMVGVLNVDSATPGFFTDQDAENLQAFADQVAIAIQNARLFAAETEQRRFAETLRDIAATINLSLDQDAVLSAILENIRRVVPHDTATIMLIEEGMARVAGASGYVERGLQEAVMRLSYAVDKHPAMQHIIERNEPLIIHETIDNAYWKPAEGFEWVRTCVTAPIHTEGRVIGFVNLYSTQPGFFTTKHAERLQAFAYQASNAIRNARLFTAEHNQRRFAEALRDTMAAVNSSLNPDEVLAQLLLFVGRVVPHDAANIMLVQGDEVVINHSHGYAERGYADILNNWRYPLAHLPFTRRVIDEGVAALVSDTANEPDWDATVISESQWIRATLKAPIVLGDDVIGLLNLDSATPHAFTAEHMRQLTMFATYAATAVRNARLFAAETEQRRFAETLRDTIAAINSSLDPNEVLEQLLHFVGRVVPHDAANIMGIQDGEAFVTHSRGYAERGVGEAARNWRYPLTRLPTMVRAMEQGTAVLVSDTSTDPDWDTTDMPEARWIRSSLQAPIQLGEDVVGILNLDSATPGAFTPEHVRLLTTFADYTATAIRNARLFTSERDQRTLAEALSTTAATILRTLDFDEVFEHILENLGRVVPHDAANVILIDADGLTNVVGHRGYTERGLEEWITGLRVPIQDIPGMQQMRETRLPITHPDTRDISGWALSKQSHWVMSYIGAPIRHDNRVIGFLNVYSGQPRFYSEEHTNHLQSFADQAAIAIRNAQLFAGEREQRTFSEALRATADAINRTLEFDEVLDFVLAHIVQVVPHDAANIMLIEEGVARVVRGHGYEKYGIRDWVMQQRYAVDEVPDWKEMTVTGQPFVIQDTRDAAGWLGQPEIDWIRSSVKAPIRVEGRVIGILHLDSAAPNTFNQTHAERLLAFADQAAIALRNAEFFAAEHDQRTFSEALRDTAEAINSTLEFDTVLDRILDHVGRVMPYDNAHVLLIEGDAGEETVRIASQYPQFDNSALKTWIKEHRFKLAETPNFKRMVDTRTPFAVPNVKEYPAWVYFPETAWIESHAAAPIILDDHVIGFLALDSRTPGLFSQRHADRLQAFANQAAIAIRNAQLFAALQRQAAELEQRVEERTEQLEQRRAQLQAILDSINEGVIYDEKLAVKYGNRALKDLTGYAAHELARYLEPLRSTHHTPNQFAQLIVQIYETVADTGFWQDDLMLRRKDGREFDAELTVTDVRNTDGDVIGAVTVIRDISQEKALQAQRDRFIASASHELRTPLTNFKTRLYLIEMQPERARDHLVVLDQVARNMTELVENLLDVSRFERGVISLRQEPTVLQTLIDQAVTMQRADADKKRVSLVTDLHTDPLRVNADPARLLQVITNLIANAINYTPAGGTITVELAPDDAGNAMFRVCDTGIGIDTALLPQIFDPFFRANEDAAEGTGLGLTIAREIVELHGGTIQADSAENKGSTFTVKLKLLE